MTCNELKNEKGERVGFICGPKVYRFDGWLFEVHSYCGPWPLNKDFGPRKTPPGREFWKMYEVFDALTDAAKRALEV